MKRFSYEWEAVSYTIARLKLSGVVDRSIDPIENLEIKKLVSEFEIKASSKLITIDVTDLRFWDTEGIHAIIGQAVLPLVRKGARIGFFGRKLTAGGNFSQVYDDAQLKYEDIASGLVRWEETEERLLEQLRG